MNSLPIEKQVKPREIKFRVWSSFGRNKMIYLPMDGNFSGEDIIGGLDWKVMQYTDLHDKNGKEIYESDYLDFNGLVYEVVFEDGCWTAKCLTTGPNPDGSESLRPDDLVSNLSSISVVDGNIYEDKDLLEQGLVGGKHE